jgi:uncharacterized membrane protein YecN with MAPEG domain
MKRNLPLIFLSLATLLLLTFHIAHDTVRQAEGSMTYPIPVTVFTLMLAATLMGSDRLWGHIVMLLGGLFGVAMIVVHAKGVVVRNSGGFFFTWTLFAMSATGCVTMVLAVREMWLTRRERRPRAAAG